MQFLIGWRQVASCFVLLASAAMITSAYGVVALPLAQEFGPSRMVLMLAITVVSVTSALIAPPLGWLMDRFSMRWIMLAGGTMLATGFATLSFVTSFNQVLLVYGLLIAPANVLMGPTAATVLLSRWFVKRRGTAIGIAIAGVSTGGFAFPLVIQFLLEAFEWREAMRVFAGALAILVVPAAALVVNAPADRSLHPDGEAEESEQSRAETQASLGSAWDVLKDPAFWLIGILFAVVLSGMIGMVTNLPALATDHGVDPVDAAFLVSMYSMAGFIAKLGFAAFAERLGPRALTLVAFGGFAGGMACLTQAHAGYWTIALGACMVGLFGGLFVPLKSLLVPRVFGRRVVGRAMGMMSTVTLGIAIVTPPAFGYAFDLTGSYAAVMAIFAGLSLLAILGVPYIRMNARTTVPA